MDPYPRGPDWMPITPKTGSLFHADSPPLADCDFNRAALHPAYPIKCRTSTQRTQAPESVDTLKSLSPLDPLEKGIRRLQPSPSRK